MMTNVLRVLLVLLLAATGISAQTVWTRYAGNPVFEPGPPGAWDRNSAGIVSVIRDEGVYKAWYVGADDTATRIGYATSMDGIVWDRQATPVLELGSVGTWDAMQVDHACVLKVGGVYRMWYSGDDGASSRIGYATSPDGIHWDRYGGNPVLDLGPSGSWEESEILHPSVLFDGSLYHMWYNGYGQNAQRTGYATSPDGIVWTRSGVNPVLPLGPPGSFDDFMLALMAAMRKDGLVHLWYTAGDGTDGDAKYFRIGYATSSDGVAWTKYPGNPVLDVGPAGTWDSVGVVTSCVLFDSTEGIFKMWYGGWGGGKIGTGYATSQPATFIAPVRGGELPRQMLLHQNYPNPCNPSTTIVYVLPRQAHVSLRLFTLLGQEVAVLCDGERGPGRGELTVNVAEFASGLYLYRLSDGISVASRLMMVLK